MVRCISPQFILRAPGSYTLYVRNLADPSCVTMSGSTTSINSIPPLRLLFRQLRVLLSLHVLCNLAVLVLPRNQELNIV
jgi:hypothetical protein